MINDYKDLIIERLEQLGIYELQIINYIAGQFVTRKLLFDNWQKEKNVNEKVKEYIYKNSIPLSLTSNSSIHKLDFEGDINEVLEILSVEEVEKC